MRRAMNTAQDFGTIGFSLCQTEYGMVDKIPVDSLICAMRFILMTAFIIATCLAQAQIWDHSSHQPPEDFDNVHVQKIHTDSTQSTFIIWVKKSVKPHYHANHTEFLYILSGQAEMVLNDSTFQIEAGDYFIIPKGSVHSVQVKGSTPLKVISIQTPEFLGKDRIWVDE
jgi:mannose-6-phosphate isomerase-like protein (cupin superfamily)